MQAKTNNVVYFCKTLLYTIQYSRDRVNTFNQEFILCIQQIRVKIETASLSIQYRKIYKQYK